MILNLARLVKRLGCRNVAHPGGAERLYSTVFNTLELLRFALPGVVTKPEKNLCNSYQQ